MTSPQPELIDDRALEAVADDRFRHADLAVELADLATTVRPPANIALFGPWGSGKSGMANLLRVHLSGKPGWGKSLRFARFDAFKFAEAPLRRNFIAEMARQLSVEDERFAKGLYQSTTESTFKFNKTAVKRICLAFLLSFALVVALTVIVLLLVALVSKGSTSHNISWLLGRYLIAAVPLSALITGFVGLATKGLTVNTTRAAPSTEEEFEERFCDLLDRVDAERVVVFIDELDRCAPNEVASTLETIKTFLEVERCVFIVAADHQVLEQALRKRVRQETPYDVSNPYYSAGTSYLDKVFQFQISLPPLKPRRLTSFAIDLVRGRPGVWSRIERLDDVVTVLVPTHVTSPRRVKVLLNSFALAYRLAERRSADGALAGNLDQRAAEIARLTCLRCEFPLFATEVERDVRLIEAVQRYAEVGRDADGSDGVALDDNIDGFPDDLLERARAYYYGERPVAELLVDDEGNGSGDDDEAVARRGEPSVAMVQSAHAQQLARYLLKTAHVPGPLGDLVHLESSGAGLSIDPVDVQELERAAVDNDARAVERLLDRLSADRRPDALRLLASEVAEAHPGVEGDNVTSILLRAVAAFPASCRGIANELAAAVVQHERAAGLRPDSYSGALVLADSRGGHVGDRLREQVLRQPGALENTDVALALLRQSDRLPASQLDALGAATAWLLLTEHQALLGNIDDQLPSLATALKAAEPIITDRLSAHYEAIREIEATAGPETSPPTPAATEEGNAVEATDDRILDGNPAAAARGLIAAFLENRRRADAQAIAALFLRCSEQPLRDAVEPCLDELAPIDDADTRLALLDATTHRGLASWPRWLGALPDHAEIGESEQEVVEELARVLWVRATSDDAPSADTVRAALDQLVRVAGGHRRELIRQLYRTAGTGVETDAAAEEQAHQFALAWELAAAGLLTKSEVADLVVEACADTLRHDKSPTVANDGVAAHVVASLKRALRLASAGRVADLQGALPDNPWLDSYEAEPLALEAAVRSADTGGDPPELDVVRKCAYEWETHVSDEVGYWLEVVQPPPAAAWEVLRHLSHEPPTHALSEALRRYSSQLTTAERLELLTPVLEEPFTGRHDFAFLQANGLADLEAKHAAPLLISAAERATNDAQRRTVLKLWQALGPAGDAVRRQLIEGIWLPLAEGGPTTLRAALDYFALVVPAPRGMQRALVARLRGVKPDNKDLARALDRRLLDAGWIKRGWFGGRRATDDREA